MSDKVKTEKKVTEKAATKAETKVEVSPAAPADLQGQRPNRPGLFGHKTGADNNPAESPVTVLVEITGTDPVVFAALKDAYGWTERTKLTRENFLRLRDEWLQKPAKEA